MLYLLHWAHSHLDKGGSAVRVTFFDFFSAFNTIQPLQLRDKLERMQVDPPWSPGLLTTSLADLKPGCTFEQLGGLGQPPANPASDLDPIPIQIDIHWGSRGLNHSHHTSTSILERYRAAEKMDPHALTEMVIKTGESVTLQCSVQSLTSDCSGEHSVYWIRHGSGESHPGIIYTHGNRSDQCKSSSETDSSTQSCVYKLLKRNLSLSDAGTYYCAVAACGQILFGNGTKVNVQAFDTVNHKILLSVLTDLGITSTAWKWFESYLEDRHYQVCNRISACLTDISSWMTAHHLKLSLSPSKTELLFIPSTTGPHRDLAISFGNSLIAPTEDARSLGVILDGQLSFSAHIANLTRSCRFLLYNIRRIRPFLSQEATRLLVQSLVISRLDYCNSLLAGLPLRAIRPLQLVQNAAAHLIFNLPKFTHVTPLLRSLHWLPVVARIRFKTLMLAYKAKNGPAPPYLMAIVPALAPVRAVSELV
ncbi:hypothetical protein NFI96_007173, partial [Prochilodus magdalenae]